MICFIDQFVYLMIFTFFIKNNTVYSHVHIVLLIYLIRFFVEEYYVESLFSFFLCLFCNYKSKVHFIIKTTTYINYVFLLIVCL
ncbi:hypothetical protein LCR_11450 [Aeromonas enteropelogenes]|uniref:Uncharacterized protein n=1 Tax=Aeromonas enteropelogenes TaxID=29489 RepID=A0A175VJQ7_AEREN|nr:hypothetical protein LCR_11450 [Aeromonas enteropelogenes]